MKYALKAVAFLLALSGGICGLFGNLEAMQTAIAAATFLLVASLRENLP